MKYIIILLGVLSLSACAALREQNTGAGPPPGAPSAGNFNPVSGVLNGH
jgi:hypothetical protein